MATVQMNTTFMTVTINGQAHQLPEGATLAQAIEALGIQPPFAAAVNLQFVPKTQYLKTLLKPNDSIELIAPVTGG
jgi:sulfur carrier protein